LALESEPPPSLPEGSWHGVRRLLVLYGLLLACSALFALLIGLKAAPESELDALITSASAALVTGFSLHEWRLLWPLLDPRRLRLSAAIPIAIGVVVTVAVLQGYFAALEALDVPTLRSWPTFEEAGWPLWSALLLVAAAPGVFEELAFRGLIYQGLHRVMTRRDALLVQAMAFSVLHLSPWIFVSHFLMGLSLGLLRDATRSLYPGMLAHFCWNAWIILGEAGVV
jgi:membrane protease YdiL (CAAX protease family)